jgi:enamine deaminase RidA (YjgF/YER057c/UK114 family)
MKKSPIIPSVVFMVAAAGCMMSCQRVDGKNALKISIRHINPDGLHRNPAFSQVVVTEGKVRTVYVGGQNSVNSAGFIIGEKDLRAQAEQVFKNLEIALAAGGAKLENVVKWNVYVVQGQPVEPAFDVFQRVWGGRPDPPVITLVYVPGLADPDFLLEMDAVAVVPEE